MTTQNAVNTSLSGQTGTGNFVGSINPTIGAPLIQTALLDSNSNIWITQGANASAVNNVEIFNAATGNSPTISGIGSDSNVILLLTGKGTGGVAVQGTGTNNSAASGYVGEIISTDNIATGTSLTSATPANVVSISLTAGDWDVWGNLIFIPGGATTYSTFAGSITTSSATISNPSISASSFSMSLTFAASQQQWFALSPCRISIASTTTVYLVAQSTFAVSTLKGAAILTARRAR